MGRPELPIDPSEGPLQAFASDLRLLRTKIGQPSYRRLALKANFSPSALSSAASGTSCPSLQVTLAYVTACEGDVVEWEKRWHDLQSALAAQQMAAQRAPPPPPPTLDDEALARAPAPRWRRPLATGAAALAGVTACDWLISMDDGPEQVLVVGILAGLFTAVGVVLGGGRRRPNSGT